MDESKAIEQVAAAYEKLTRQSGRIQALEKKLAEGTITMKEGAELNDLRAKAFGRALSGSVTGIERGSREGACVGLLKDRCGDVDELAQAAQKTALTRQGLNITPPTAPFEEERARKIGRSLEDDTVPDETIQRRARSATETMLRSQYDRDMKQGAETCASAGLKTYIVRDADPGCCKWCDEVSGRFAYGTEPKDVYRRHDNCSCTVVYESSRGKQNVWSKQTWSKEQEQKYLELRDELKAKKMTAAPDVKKPVRLSEKDIQAIIAKVGGLTYGRYSDIMKLSDILTNTDHEITDENISKVPKFNVFGSDELSAKHQQHCKELLEKVKSDLSAKAGTEYSIVYDSDFNPIPSYGYQKGGQRSAPIYDPGIPHHALHNHGSGETFSYDDLIKFSDNKNMLSLTAVGNVGSLYVIQKEDTVDRLGFKLYLNRQTKKTIYSANGINFSYALLEDIEKKRADSKILESLSKSQTEELKKALIAWSEECARGSEAYGYKYTSKA